MKKKTKIPLITTRAQADNILSALVQNINIQRALIIERDACLEEIRLKYEPDISSEDEAIENRTAQLAAWAAASPEFPKAAKSLALTSGTIGFRTDPPSVALLKKPFTWKIVLETILVRKFRSLIRVKREVDKETILSRYQAAKNKPVFEKFLATLGLKIVQAEQFYVEPNLTQTQTRQTTETK